MSKRVTEKRDIELDNIVGNLIIAEYQVDKLQSRLGEMVGRYGSMSKKESSSSVFKKNDKWYRITLSVEKMAYKHKKYH
ncbi:MAG: hypothetical protein ACRD8W_13695 [Nitrososphaeraceae archaeon]